MSPIEVFLRHKVRLILLNKTSKLKCFLQLKGKLEMNNFLTYISVLIESSVGNSEEQIQSRAEMCVCVCECVRVREKKCVCLRNSFSTILDSWNRSKTF